MLKTRRMESRVTDPMIGEAASDRNREVPKDLIQRCLLVGTFLALSDDQGTRGAVLTRRKGLGSHAGDDHGAGRNVAFGHRLLGARDIHDGCRARQYDVGTEYGAFLDPTAEQRRQREALDAFEATKRQQDEATKAARRRLRARKKKMKNQQEEESAWGR